MKDNNKETFSVTRSSAPSGGPLRVKGWHRLTAGGPVKSEVCLFLPLAKSTPPCDREVTVCPFLGPAYQELQSTARLSHRLILPRRFDRSAASQRCGDCQWARRQTNEQVQMGRYARKNTRGKTETRFSAAGSHACMALAVQNKDKHNNISWMLEAGLLNFPIFHSHKRTWEIHPSNIPPTPAHFPAGPEVFSGAWWITVNTRINPPHSVPQLQQEPDPPLWAYCSSSAIYTSRENIPRTYTAAFLLTNNPLAPAAVCGNTSDFFAPRERYIIRLLERLINYFECPSGCFEQSNCKKRGENKQSLKQQAGKSKNKHIQVGVVFVAFWATHWSSAHCQLQGNSFDSCFLPGTAK